MWEHRLLERRERAGLDDVGGDRAGERDEDEGGQPPGECKDRAGDRHEDEEQSITAATPHPVPVAAYEERRERRAGEQCRENQADLAVGEPSLGERDADQDRSQPVRGSAQALRSEDPSGVTQSRSR
jgi:hypothetical protein